MQRRFWIVLLCVWLTGGCLAPLQQPATGSTGSCSLGLPLTATDEDAVRAVLLAEGSLVVQQDIDALMALWSDGAKIVNAKNTPDVSDDDQSWFDTDAIRHRYVRTVFPGAPAKADPKDLQIQLIDDQAIVTATTQIGTEISPAGDRWELRKHQGCWEIQSLTYNLEAK
jgi:hypothetical protein